MLKKVLIITYYWPPSGGAGVQRWLKFVKYLPSLGWQPIVYTPANPEAPSLDESLLKDIPNTVEVIKKPIWEPYTFYKNFTGKSKNDKINAGFIQEKESSGFLEKISVFVRGNFFIPDARKFWVKPSVKFLKKYIKDNNIETIITTGPPHSMHLIGVKLKQQLKINWIADFRDPWTNIDFYKDLMLTVRSDKKHKRLEKKVLQQADKVITVGKTLSNELNNLGAKNTKVITNGYDTDDVNSLHTNLDKRFTILHSGSLNKDRNHNVFWQALANLTHKNNKLKTDLEIKLVGKVDVQVLESIRKYGLDINLNKIDYVSHNEIIEKQQSARVLYLPINNTPNSKGILTGKFFEYMAVNRPILAIGSKQSDIDDILQETKSGQLFDFDDLNGVENFIASEYHNYENNILGNASVNISKYSREALTKELSDTLNKVIDG